MGIATADDTICWHEQCTYSYTRLHTAMSSKAVNGFSLQSVMSNMLSVSPFLQLRLDSRFYTVSVGDASVFKCQSDKAKRQGQYVLRASLTKQNNLCLSTVSLFRPLADLVLS